MSTAKIAVTLDQELLVRLDELVSQRQFSSRSRAVQEAIQEKLARLDRTRLTRECEKLDPRLEQELAEHGFAAGTETWPKY